MSNVSNIHSVVPFTSGESKPLTGQRLARVGYKKTKEQPNPLPSVCASIPFLPVPTQEQIQALLPHIGNLLEAAQDGIFRSLYESSEGQLKEIRDEDLSIAQCIAFLNSQNASAKLSADAIKNWCDATIRDDVLALIATKLKFTDIAEDVIPVLEKHYSAYRELMAQLAAYKGVMTPKQRNGLKAVLALAPENDPMATRLLGKITAMESVESGDLLELI